jgi:transposase InsO family protein
MMKVTRSAYYAYRNELSYQKSLEEIELGKQVKEVFLESRRRYGSRRITVALQKKGIKVGRHLVRKLMKEQGLQAIVSKSFKPKTTISNNKLASPNLLKEEANKAVKPKQVIIGDITYVALADGSWIYLAIWQDQFTRRVVGWKMATSMTEDLVIEALKKALWGGYIEKGAIIHTDRGSQYSSNNFRQLLKERGLRQSMSGTGNCYDNAQAESFFARYKTELMENGMFEDIEQGKSETFSYIEGFYNRVRIHSGLGNLSPEEFEKKLEKEQIIQKERAG